VKTEAVQLFAEHARNVRSERAARLLFVMASKRITKTMLNALKSLARSDRPRWTLAAIARLKDLGLIRFVPRYARVGNQKGSDGEFLGFDVKVTSTGRALLKSQRTKEST